MKKVLLLVSLFFFALASASILHGGDDPGGGEKETVDISITNYFDKENEIPVDIDPQPHGSRISFDADIGEHEGYEFAYWIVNGNIRKDLPLDHEFVVRSQMDIKAHFSPDEQHLAVFMDANENWIDTMYVEDKEAVEETPDVAGFDKPGYLVADPAWDKPLSDITENTVFILQYERDLDDTYALTVENGSTDETEYLFNEVATVTADGEDFSHWMIDDTIVSYDETYSFTMVEDVTIEGVYEGALEEEPLVTISDAYAWRDGHDSHVGQFYLPESYELIEYGMITTSAPFDAIDLNTEGITHVMGSKFVGATNEFLVTVASETSENPRAYLVYEHEGELGVVYSETVNDEVVMEWTSRDIPQEVLIQLPDGMDGYVQEFSLYVYDPHEDEWYMEGQTEDGELIVCDCIVDVDPEYLHFKIDGVFYQVTEVSS